MVGFRTDFVSCLVKRMSYAFCKLVNSNFAHFPRHF